MRLVRLRKSPYGLLMATGTLLLFLFIMYVLGIFSRGHENKIDDVERILDRYMKHRESRSFQELEELEHRLRRIESSLERQQRAQIQAARKGTPRHKQYPPVVFLTESDRKRILVTGGAGFVGSHLVDTLLREGHEVTVVDNFFTGRKRNVEHWIGHENFELLNHDVVNPLMIEVDQIYHLASPASPKLYMYNPIKTLKTNALGTLNLLGLAKRVRARFLLASTSEVYGDPEVHPQVESYWGHVNPIGPRACYDEGKRVAETMSYTYANQENVEIRVARIFNTFGPRMHFSDGRVVSNFIIQALQNKNLTLFGTGLQTRSFMYVSDLVDGLIKLMNSNVSSPVNLGNPEEYTIYEFAEMIKKEVGGKSKIVHLPPVEDDPRKRKPDIQKAWEHLHWKPVVPVKEGIRRTVEYFRKELEVAKRTHNISEIFVEPIRI